MQDYEKEVEKKLMWTKFYQDTLNDPKTDSMVDRVIFGAREELRNHLGCKIPFPKMSSVSASQSYEQEGSSPQFSYIPLCSVVFQSLELEVEFYDAFLQLANIDIEANGIFKEYEDTVKTPDSLIKIEWKVSCPFSKSDRETLESIDVLRTEVTPSFGGGVHTVMSCHLPDSNIPF